tara:strand:+ start:307 stop:1047 length:741 start_codon:yes stop_codon:yes gene_type:complete
MSVPVIILLGGKGSRFSKIDQQPKQLVNLNKNNLLTSIFLYYKKYNLNYFILPLGHKKKFFLDFFNNKKNIKKYKFNILNNKNILIKKNHINLKLFNASEKSSKLSRIYKSTKFFNSNYFMVTYGDGLADIDFDKQINYFNKIKKKNLVTICKIRSQYGHVKTSFNSGVLEFKEKPYLKVPINIGYYVFNKFDFLSLFNKKDELESEFLPKLVKKKSLFAYSHDGFFFNIDNKKDLEQVKNKYKKV